MQDIGQLYTSGLWTVRLGKEREFIEAWQSFATWTSETPSGPGEGRLLQDLEESNRFLSFGPWPSAEAVSEWRAKPEFQAFVAKARQLCEEMKPRTLKVVAYSPPARGR